ncbi:glycosyltransferase family 4 protein [Rhodoflexus caldus]|uniref:glycosyltransferase family 4 protein n=1 Tax=Rhodoflexus caldus TaxID=2891236 RepID=UPI00202A172F|nr:glycosyltransferase family 4 protein [Rhodoflexus caldus]
MERSPKILFAVNHRLGRSPGQRFRFEQYLQILSEAGFSYDISPLLPTPQDDAVFYAAGNYIGKLRIMLNSLWIRLRDLWRIKQYDIVFLYREAHFTRLTIFEKLFKWSGVKMIVDFDDAIWLPVISEGNKMLAWLKNARKIDEIIRRSDLVIVGNTYLAAYARQFNSHVAVVPTTLDTTVFYPENPRFARTRAMCKKDNQAVVIGWTGSFSTIEHFEYGIPALLEIKKKYAEKVRFKLIGDSRYKHAALNIQGVAWHPDTELEELGEIDIGIMPLPDNEWTRGKCGFKGLTYMSLAIPAVLAPVGINKDIIRDGENGFLAATTDEWVEKLSLLVENEALRKRIGEAGKQTVWEFYSQKSQKERYVQLFENLLSRQ